MIERGNEDDCLLSGWGVMQDWVKVYKIYNACRWAYTLFPITNPEARLALSALTWNLPQESHCI